MIGEWEKASLITSDLTLAPLSPSLHNFLLLSTEVPENLLRGLLAGRLCRLAPDSISLQNLRLLRLSRVANRRPLHIRAFVLAALWKLCGYFWLNGVQCIDD